MDLDEYYLDYDCQKHGKGRSPSGDCPKCLHEADLEVMAEEGAHGLCSNCRFADWERSSARATWCTAWKKEGFPVKKYPKKKCGKYQLIPPDALVAPPDDYDLGGIDE